MAAFHFLLLLLTFVVIQLSEASRPSLFSSNVDSPQMYFNGTKWAVLVAGSSEWFNYRHQVCIISSFLLIVSNMYVYTKWNM